MGVREESGQNAQRKEGGPFSVWSAGMDEQRHEKKNLLLFFGKDIFISEGILGHVDVD